ncbi:DUF2809 domain-containing protein [Terrimonas sp.]|uniref:ribosomal maturation YjgA family protein n=1 Tax=Terrimonas sp. TaxID=1914338 RepID=UPI000D515B70|nr:DUF2809 domain-containing protein [Terrimonas sp.]PVD50680.1 DUF2809 domain-containing protein [Terrimonas sp.]
MQKSTLRFNLGYFTLFILLFITEVLIALYSHNSVLRSYIGDVLVVVLIYCFVRSFFNTPVFITAVAVLIFACLVETLQYFKIVHKLGLEHSVWASVIIGTSFSWWDIVSYVAGIIIVLAFEKLK